MNTRSCRRPCEAACGRVQQTRVPGWSSPGRKSEGLGGEGGPLKAVLEDPCCCRGLLSEAGDLRDGMLIGRGAGDQVKVFVVKACDPQGVFPVPLRGVDGLNLRGVAFQGTDPGSGGILG